MTIPKHIWLDCIYASSLCCLNQPWPHLPHTTFTLQIISRESKLLTNLTKCIYKWKIIKQTLEIQWQNYYKNSSHSTVVYKIWMVEKSASLTNSQTFWFHLDHQVKLGKRQPTGQGFWKWSNSMSKLALFYHLFPQEPNKTSSIHTKKHQIINSTATKMWTRESKISIPS